MLVNRLVSLRKSKKYTQHDFSEKLGIPRSTYSNYEAGNREPDNKTLKLIAEKLETTTDYLLGNTDDPNPRSKNNVSAQLTAKDEKDIAKRMEKMKKDLVEANSDGDGLNFMGEPMSPEAIESLLEALEHAERIATLANKKYIPKKYRDKD